MSKQHHVWKPRQRHRELSESRNGRARVAEKSSPLDQTVMLMSAHTCRNRHPRVLAQAPTTSESTVIEQTVSAQTSDPEIEVTSAELQVDGKRNDGDNKERGCKPAVETKRDSKRLRHSSLRDSWRRKYLRMTSSDWYLTGQTALRLRHSSVSCKTRSLTKGKTLTWFAQASSPAAIAACHPVKLNLESERKEDVNADSVERGPKDYISEVRESSLWASIRDHLTPLDVLATRTAGLKWNCAKLYGEFAALWFFLMTKDKCKRGSARVAQPVSGSPSNFRFRLWYA